MTEPLRLGIAGLGTVGAGVVKIIRQKAALLAERSGRAMTISAVTARHRDRDRGVSLDDYAWEDDAVALATRDDVDVFVELIGGSDGPAKAATEAALNAGKDVVTANKAMLAHHGQALARLAEDNGCVLRFEAAVAGGIPVIKALTEGLAGNEITRVMGVMNGTCNYILTRMESGGLTYGEAFDEADKLGFLEADPELDVGGIDAGHKLALLAAIAYRHAGRLRRGRTGRHRQGHHRRYPPSRRHGFQDQAAGRVPHDGARSGTAHGALPRARHVAARAAGRRHQHGGHRG